MVRYLDDEGTTIASHSRIKPEICVLSLSFNFDFVDATPATIAKPLMNATSERFF